MPRAEDRGPATLRATVQTLSLRAVDRPGERRYRGAPCGASMPPRARMNWEQLCKLGRELPEVEEGVWYRTPALKVRGKGFVRLKEDGESVVFLLDDVDDQELLIEAQPELYHVTPHYLGYAAVLARLAKLTPSESRLRLQRAWLQKAPPALVERWEAAVERRPGRAPGTRAKKKA